VALKLVDEGFLISFVNTDYNHSRIAEANKTSLSNHVMIRSVVVPDGLPSTDTRTDIAKLCDVTENVIVPFLVRASCWCLNSQYFQSLYSTGVCEFCIT
jgi:hypothetical protein